MAGDSPKLILIGAITAFTVLSLVLEENYPFSHYPMYSDPDPVSQYYHLTDGDGKPLPSDLLTGVRSSNLGKIYRKRLSDHANSLKVHVKRMPEAERTHVARETVAYLRNQAKHHGHQLPEHVRLMYTTIQFEGGRVVEKPEVVYSE